jgi:zinc protease
MTYVGPAIGSDAAPALAVLEAALSGGESSRLYQSLIYAQELAQTAEFKADLRADMGLLMFQLVLASGVDVAKARSALLEEIKKVCEAPLLPAELSTAKNKLLAMRLAERETCEGKAAALAEAAALRGDPALVNSDFAKLDAITAEEVQAAARQWFTDDNRLVLEYLPAKGVAKK